ncbi:hypothetical protein DNFV4_00321 [Nitrospira tepida]|uniref:Uncharacterized protein n=1 Tax=Nitrospira tepida TaxID=2973512 RepID=A0AA86T188_9BACT|nr:hypothetical protein [Nitrospira tepida]CAI4029901.1 hypothetical protein DNFV4_00321 [Nitrospira tepida]
MAEEMRTPDEFGPYLNAAFICEKVLREQDGVMSAIRIIDRVTHAAPGPDVMEPFPYRFALVLNFKSGEALGTYQISIQPIKPNNEKLQAAVYPVNFESPGDRGVGICADMQILFDVPGLWWFDIYLSGEGRVRRVSRIPFRIIYLPQPVKMSG